MREQVLRPPEGEGGSRVCDQKRWESGKGRGKEGAPKMIALGFFDIGGRGLRGWAGSRGVGESGGGGRRRRGRGLLIKGDLLEASAMM